MKDRNELLLKLKNLRDKGIGGEADNAEALLQKLMKKYNVTEEDLCDEVRTKREFTYWGLCGEELMTQIAYSVIGSEYKCYKYKGRRFKILLIETTEAEKIEIEEMFLFYRSILDEGFKTYYQAFVQAESLFPDPSKVKPKEKDEQSETSRVSMDAIKLASMMNKHNRNKLITDGK